MQGKLAIGIDIGSETTQISYLIDGMAEPDTLEELIPTTLEKAEDGTWKNSEENVEQAVKFIIDCLKKVPGLKDLEEIDSLCITYRKPKKEFLRQIEAALILSGIEKEKIYFESHEESAVHFALSQENTLWQREVIFFELSKDGFSYCSMRTQRAGRKTKIFMQEKDCSAILSLSLLETEESRIQADKNFLTLLQPLFGKRIINAVYLIGEGFFQENWAVESLRYICIGRRAFKGLNLYTKGACYKAYDRIQKKVFHDFLLLCPGRLKSNIGVKILQKGNEYVIHLAKAGKRWHEETREIECIVDDIKEAEFVIVPADETEEWTERVSLQGLPYRENKMTRIRVGLELLEEDRAQIILTDLGFGKFAKESGITITREIFLEKIEEKTKEADEDEKK